MRGVYIFSDRRMEARNPVDVAIREALLNPEQLTREMLAGRWGISEVSADVVKEFKKN